MNRPDDKKIPTTYFDTKRHQHNVTIIPHLVGYTYGINGLALNIDLSNRLLDYSYDCDSKSDMRQSANVNIYIGNFFDSDPMRLEHQQIDWAVKDVEGQAGYQVFSVVWTRLIYRLWLEYQCKDTGEEDTLDFGYFLPSSSDYNYDPTTSSVSLSLIGLSAFLTSDYGGGILGAREEYPVYEEKNGIISVAHDEWGNMKTQIFLLTQSLEEGTNLDADLIKWILNPTWNKQPSSSINVSDFIPLNEVYVNTENCGVMIDHLPTDLDFDTDVSRMDMIQKVIETCYLDGHCWIDENQDLWINSRQELRRHQEPVLYWKDYEDLVMSYSVSADDTGFFNVVEVFGKDGEYYGLCDYSNLDEMFRKKTMTFEELQSNAECEQRAKWEAYKSRWGHENITVTLVNRYLPELANPSHQVGRTIEFTTADGSTNLFWLDKLSFSGNTITMNLTVFKPLYNTDDVLFKETLKQPYITGTEVIDNHIIRVYVDGEDIEWGVVKLYQNYNFRAESVSVDENGRHYVDLPVTHGGLYRFSVNLYSPHYEPSGIGGIENYGMTQFDVDITGIKTGGSAVDPYPHLPILPSQYIYIKTENGYILATDKSQKIYIGKEGD